jgi:hypothetical protein
VYIQIFRKVRVATARECLYMKHGDVTLHDVTSLKTRPGFDARQSIVVSTMGKVG